MNATLYVLDPPRHTYHHLWSPTPEVEEEIRRLVVAVIEKMETT